MREILLAANAAFAFFGASIYLGLFWSLHFFWYPGWALLTIDNFRNQFFPPIDAATHFFTILVPLMFLSLIVTIVAEWKSGYAFWPSAAFVLLGASIYVGQLIIFPLNAVIRAGVPDQAHLTADLLRWMSLNDIRGVIITAMWIAMMCYFIARPQLLNALRGGR